MERRFWIELLVCMLLCTVASAQENLLINPEIERFGDMAIGWTANAWDADRSVLEVLPSGGVDDSSCLHIQNLTENDARFVQNVFCEPDTVYRLSCMVRASNVEGGSVGANISVANAFSYSEPVFDTAGEWTECVLYGKTGPDQFELDIYVRLGGYSAIATGEAWFDNICFVEAESIPDGVFIQPLYRPTQNHVDEKEISADAEPSSLPWLAWSLVFALLSLAVVLLAFRSGKTERSLTEEPRSGCIWALLLLAAAVRLLIAACVEGFETDIGCFLSWSETAFSAGPRAFYAATSFCDYPPGYIWVLWVCGAIRALLGRLDGGMLAIAVCKLPNIVADVIACRLLISVLRKRVGLSTACILALLYALNPAVVLDSAGWGQADGLLALAIAVPLWFCTQKNWLACLLTYAVAVLLKPQALLFAPLGVLVLVTEIVRDRKALPRMLLGLGGAVVLWVFVSLPFALDGTSAAFPNAPALVQPILWLAGKYLSTLSSYAYYTVSACNFWDLLGLNWVEIGTGIPQMTAMLLPYAVAFGLSIFCYVKNQNRSRIYLIGATMLAVIFAFALKMHERYLFPAILLLCLAYSVDQDIRICIALVLLSCAQFVNMGLVLSYDWTTLAPRGVVVACDCAILAGTGLLVWTCLELCLRERVRAITRIYRPSVRRLDYQEKEAHRAMHSGLFRVPDDKMRLSPREWCTIAVVTVLYAVFAFVNLGTLSAPQTSWTSSRPGEEVVFDLGEQREFVLTYYGGLCNSTFTVEFSDDGETYTDPEIALYDQGEIFRWLWFKPMKMHEDGSLSVKMPDGYSYTTARYVRITALERGLVLSEVGFLSPEKEVLPVVRITGPEQAELLVLCDEQNTVPANPSYYNSSYFDEIYHARTAYENIHGLHTYEWTHPPLGKLLIAAGILLFKMTPFGWRFMGALSGVLMLPVMYLLVRQISKSRLAATVGMLFMALDCMHFTQTRIATIDCFAVLFIMCMYLCMFRYCSMSFYHQPLRKTLVPLGLCGLFFALGCATKWICIYAGAGLAVLFFVTLGRRYQEYRHARAGMRAFSPEEKRLAAHAEKSFAPMAIKTCLFCIVFFVVLPLLIYYFSYYWQLKPDDNFSVSSVWNLQKTIFGYHSGLGDDDHYFRSPWYEWPLIIKPMWYYSGTDFQPAGWISSISCMGNPVVWWGGLVALVYVAVSAIRSRGRDRAKLLLLVGFASQYLPWVLVPRSTFIYHYFASVPFIIAAVSLFVADLEKKNAGAAKKTAIIGCITAALLCMMFYPLMSGTPVPRVYANLLRWFNWYNF